MSIRPPEVAAKQRTKRSAVVFVHGFTGDALNTWASFPEMISDDPALSGWDVFAYGYATSVAGSVPFWKGNPGPERLYRALTSEADTSPLAGYDAVAFVAHSMGGLVVQGALASDAGLARRTSHVILFGTPSGGLRKAYLGAPLNRQVRSMTPFHVWRLRRRWNKAFGTQPKGTPTCPFTLTVVDGEQDDFVGGRSALRPFDERYRYTTNGDHVTMVKPGSIQHRSYRIVADRLRAGTSGRGPVDGARVAVELGEFRRAVETFEGEGVVADDLEWDAAVQYAMALCGIGRQADAVTLLEARPEKDTESDVLGTLGGRYKRAWLSGRVANDGAQAEALYQRGYALAREDGDAHQEYYHAINLGFLCLLRERDRDGARAWARVALDACDRAHPEGRDVIWHRATVGEAHLLLGDEVLALAAYGDVAAAGGGNPWEYASAYHQAMRIAEHERWEATAATLRDMFGLPFPPA